MKHKGKNMDINEQTICEIWDNFKWCKVHGNVVCSKRRREGKICEEKNG